MSAEPPSGAGARGGPIASARGLSLLTGVLLVSLTFFWGINWPALKLAVSVAPVLDFRLICLAVGGLGLLALSAFSGLPTRIARAGIPGLLLCALFNVVGWHVFSGFGVLNLESGRAAIIAFTMPVWASLQATWLIGERLTWPRVAALLLGMIGLAVLMGEDLAAMQETPVGALCMLGAAITWGTGTALLKRFQWEISTSALAGWQLLCGFFAVLVLKLFIDEGRGWNPDASAFQWAGLIYGATVPMLYCHWAWFSLVRILPASLAAISTLAIPVIGVLSSAVILGEIVGLRELAALFLVCTALAFVFFSSRLEKALGRARVRA